MLECPRPKHQLGPSDVIDLEERECKTLEEMSTDEDHLKQTKEEKSRGKKVALLAPASATRPKCHSKFVASTRRRSTDHKA